MLATVIAQILTPLGFPVFDTDATGARESSYFVLIDATPSRAAADDNLTQTHSEAGLIVRAVGVDAKQVRAMLLRSRQLLAGQALHADGIIWWCRYDGSPRPIQVERLHRDNGLNVNAMFVDDEYTLFGDGR